MKIQVFSNDLKNIVTHTHNSFLSSSTLSNLVIKSIFSNTSQICPFGEISFITTEYFVWSLTTIVALKIAKVCLIIIIIIIIEIINNVFFWTSYGDYIFVWESANVFLFIELHKQQHVIHKNDDNRNRYIFVLFSLKSVQNIQKINKTPHEIQRQFHSQFCREFNGTLPDFRNRNLAWYASEWVVSDIMLLT